MAKVKLDLQGKNDVQLRNFGTEHKAAMVGNANFTTPLPTPAVYDASLAAYGGKLDAITALEIELQTLRSQKDAMRVELEANLTARGSYVDLASGGDEAKILSSGFSVQAAATTTTSIATPVGVVATMGDNEGEIDLTCNAVAKARSYIIEMREHSETAAPGPWVQVKVVSRSSGTVSGLISGKKYAFRMRALGPNDLESPWSDETVCMAP